MVRGGEGGFIWDGTGANSGNPGAGASTLGGSLAAAGVAGAVRPKGGSKPVGGSGPAAGTSSTGGSGAGGGSSHGGAGGVGEGGSGISCSPGTRWCEQTTPMVCNAEGVPYAEPSCAGATPFCENGACVGCPGSGGPSMAVVGSFCIDTTEVTQSQYRAWLAKEPAASGQAPECAWNTDYAPPTSCTESSLVCPWETGLCDQSPQVCVDFCDAQAFCHAVGKRLCGSVSGGPASYSDPSSGQWRMACGSVYPYGTDFTQHACHDQGSPSAGTIAVGAMPDCVVLHGGQAVYDLSGNAAEWEDACSAATGAADNCHARGGSFRDSAAQLACESIPAAPFRRDRTAADLGFRCCSP